MQLMIDTDTEQPANLLYLIRLFASVAEVDVTITLRDNTEAARPAQKPAAPPIGKPVVVPAPTIPLPPGNIPPPPISHPDVHPDALPKDVPAGTDLDPAAVFGRVIPLVAATVPAVPAATVATTAPDAGSPAAGTPNAPTANHAGERDALGMPWDARVHSETKKTNADGSWRFRRNLDATVKNSVMAELKAQVMPQQPLTGVASAVPMPPAPPAVPQLPAAAVTVPPPPSADAGAVPAAPVIPPPPSTVVPFPGQTVPVQPAPVVGVSTPVVLPPATNFRELMQKVNKALSDGKITQSQLAEACKAAGADGVTALASQPIFIPQVDEYLRRWLAA